jgi:SAM-dependent methyltransferase
MFEVDNGWQASANAWIADMGEEGDFGRRYVLDRVMLQRALARAPRTALDVGCGEGRFCRMLKQHGIEVAGVDPTQELIEAARARDTDTVYLDGIAERLPFHNHTFDLVISYLSLIGIPNIEEAIPEMARVLVPGGTLLIANLNGFNTACCDTGWIKDGAGRRIYYPIDNYLEERSMWVAYRGIRVRNHHRPISAYMRILLDARLRLSYFDEPLPSADAPIEKAANYRRVPWFLVMEWVKPTLVVD